MDRGQLAIRNTFKELALQHAQPGRLFVSEQQELAAQDNRSWDSVALYRARQTSQVEITGNLAQPLEKLCTIHATPSLQDSAPFPEVQNLHLHTRSA